MTRERTLFLLCFIAATAMASAQTSGPAPPIEVILARMAQARSQNHSRFRPYTITRDYQLFGKDAAKVKSQVIADISFVPPDKKNFAIRRVEGTGLGENIVRRMLKSEVQIADDDRTDISEENYEFKFLRHDSINGRRCLVLELKPRRNDKHLMTGQAWIDAETYLLHRAEGTPAKKPSWWVKDLHFTLLYGSVEGMWLPTGIEATAKVRIIGDCKLVSHSVGFSIGQLAANGTKQKSLRRFSRSEN